MEVHPQLGNPLSSFLVGSAGWQGVPHSEAIPAVREFGFGGVEILSKPGHFEPENEAHVAEVGAALADWPEATVTFHAPFHTADLASTDPAIWQEDVEQVANALRIASTFRAESATLHTRGRGEGLNWCDDSLVAFHRALEALAPVAAECKMTLSVENMPPNRFAADSAELVELVSKHPKDLFGFCFDTGHAHLCHTVIPVAAALGSRTFVMHIHDNHAQGKDQHNVPGQGTIPWAEVVRTLQANGYHGKNVLEIVERCPDGDTIDTVRELLDDMKQAVLQTGLMDLIGSTER